MDLRNSVNRSQHTKVSLRDLLIWCFAFWPLFWNLWGSMRVTSAFSTLVPTLLLIGITIISILLMKSIKKTKFLYWVIFIGIALLSGLRGLRGVALLDISVIGCGFLFCLSQQGKQIKTDIIFRCLFACGIFVAITIILDAATHIFRTTLLSLYSDYSQDVIIRMRYGIATGGIIPHTAGAGCFLCAGLGSYIISLKRNSKKRNWIILFVFAASFLLIQKRGYLLHISAAAFAIWICGWRFEEFFKVDLRRQIRVALLLVLLIIASVVFYFAVPGMRDAVDALLGRFTEEDDTLSGRTLLYALAYNLFRRSPILGIGWGRFRPQTLGIFSTFSTSTYEAHNVYLQLLCETGVIGFIAFLLAVGGTLFIAIRRYRTMLKEGIKDDRFYSLQLGLYLQFFFLAYCMSGNPLYDYNFLITYFVGILLTLTA